MISIKRARALSASFFLLGLAFLIYTVNWWPGILAVAGLSLGLRLYLYRRYLDTLITLICFVGIFSIIEFEISGSWVLPLFFTVCAIGILRKCLGQRRTSMSKKT